MECKWQSSLLSQRDIYPFCGCYQRFPNEFGGFIGADEVYSIFDTLGIFGATSSHQKRPCIIAGGCRQASQLF
jgi:hypothetical protein